MGLDRKQEQQRRKNIRECHQRTVCSVYGFPHSLYFGHQQATDIQSDRDGYAGIRKQDPQNIDQQTKRVFPAADRKLSATRHQRKVRKDKIYYATARYSGADVYLLYQPATVYQRAVFQISRKQTPKPVAVYRYPDTAVCQTEVRYYY